MQTSYKWCATDAKQMLVQRLSIVRKPMELNILSNNHKAF